MLDIPPLEIRLIALQDHRGHFEIAPVDAAYSRELANALRRVLLASLPGAAVTSMRIDGVQHEFQTITDVLEDVTDIVQNFKKLRLRCYSDRPALMHLDVLGAGKVTARQLTVPSTVEIVNPDLHLATLDNEKADLRMEITVGTGRGFVSCEQHADRRQEKPPIGVILIDSIFSPVCHVNFVIEPVLIECRQKLDKILLEITTDGTIGPSEALRESATLLQKPFLVCATYWPPPDVPKAKNPVASHVLIPPSIYDMPIEDLDLSVRSLNSMRRAGIFNAGQVLERHDRDLMRFRNVGEKTLQDLYACFKKKGLFPQEDQE